MTDILTLEQVSKSYHTGTKSVAILNAVSCHFAQGQITALVGPSGSGKSTLLNLIAGLDPVDSGAIYFEGGNIAALTKDAMSRIRLTRMGMVFQFFNLLPTLTIRQNIELPAKLLEVSTEQSWTRATEFMERFGIINISEQYPHQCSGGELQRAAIARALMNSPRLLLADEPTGNLDRKSGDVVLETLNQVNRELGIAIILVTHDEHTQRIANRSIHLLDGELTS